MHIITEATDQTNSWQAQLNDLITEPDELIRLLNLPIESVSHMAAAQFELRLPRRMLHKIEPGNINDPILRQFLPQADELTVTHGYSADPLQETDANPMPGLIHKYHGRVLITAASQCAVNCRYCFRRHFDYRDNRIKGPQWSHILDYLAADPTIGEVIFSGGDPLAVSNSQLARWLEDLEHIDSIKRIRIHSRLPVVIPDRIDREFINLLTKSRLQKVLVIHANHPNEIDADLGQALDQLTHSRVTLLNQTVLLKGVNDQASTLADLSEGLFAMGVTPYYLHLLDSVAGAAHFDLHRQKAIELHRNLQAQLPGYLVPKLVEELPGKPSKTWV